MSTRAQTGFTRALIGLVLFGISFGYIEAAVVVYLRSIYDPVRRSLQPGRPMNELFPLLSLRDLEALDRTGEAPGSQSPARINKDAIAPLTSHMQLLRTELGREFATLLLLAGAGLMVSRNWREWLAAFVIGFGIWDLCYYAFLKLLLDWPASLFTWDILFLLPLPWVGPVLAPALVSATMIATGVLLLQRERSGIPALFRSADWLAIVGGGLVIVISFCWDWRNTAAGGYPNPFNWPLFAMGWMVSVAGFVRGWVRDSSSGKGTG